MPEFSPLLFCLLWDISNTCLLPSLNVVKDLIFCLVIPLDIWMRRTVKNKKNVFLGGGFQNLSF